MWIIGTNKILNYGRSQNMPRKKDGEGVSSESPFPIHIIAPDIYDMENKSLTEKMIPHADAIQIIHLKMQQMVAKARPPGVSVNLDALEKIQKIGGQEQISPLDIQEIYDQTGNLYFRGRDENGQPIIAKPIEELQNGISSKILELMNQYRFQLNMIRDVTGLNEAADASTPDKDALVGVQKLATQSSNNAIKGIWKGYVNLTQRLAETIILMVQDKVKYGGGVEAFKNSLGEQSAKILEMSDDISLPKFGFTLEALPDIEDREDLKKWIAIALERETIDLEDAMEVEQIKNTKKAIQTLIIKRRNRMEAKASEALEATENNAMQNALATKTKMESDIASEGAKAESKNSNLQTEYALKNQLEDRNVERQKEIDDNKSKNKIREIEAAAISELDETDLTKEVPQPRV